MSSRAHFWANLKVGILLLLYFLRKIPSSLTICAPTAIMLQYAINPNVFTDVNCTVLATNGQGASCVYKQDMNASYGKTGIAATTGVAVQIGAFVTTNQRFPLAASGYFGSLQATGPNFALIVSTPTGVYPGFAGNTGTASWGAIVQIEELPFI